MVSAANSCVLVYDVGGSHVSAAACFAPDYRLGPVVNASHPEEQSAGAFLDMLKGLAERATAGDASVIGASLAMPGPFDYENGVSWIRHKMAFLYGMDLRQALAERLGLEPAQVRFLNDAAAFQFGEVGAGAARGVARSVGITLGTGVGSGFAIHDRVVTGGVGVPPGGEIWNLPFEGGIVEDLISTRSIKKSYLEATGKEREVAAIAADAANDPAAAAVFTEFGRNLGRALKSLLEVFAPNVVVIGGGIARSAALFLPAAQSELQGLAVELRISALGDLAPLVGAGVSWMTASAASGETTPATRG